MSFSINEFRSALTGGGARPSLFQVSITNPVDAAADLKVPFMAKASSIPSSTTGMISVPYFGRKIKLAGDRNFDEPWTITVINDEDFLVRNAMESWMNAINTHEGNLIEFGTASPAEYKSQAQVFQYSKDGGVLREYTFDGLFPTEISNIDLNWETTDTVSEFTVTFQYDYWRVSGGRTGTSTS